MADNEKRQAYSKRALKNGLSQSIVWVVFSIIILVAFIVIYHTRATGIHGESNVQEKPDVWMAPDTSTIANEANKDAILYGQKLISNTAYYLGPKGTVDSISNGMNCQNCHLDAGTKPFGNNYSAVAATYPKFRARSGSVENIYMRVNDCFIRSLNGKALDTTTKEMQAIVAYIKWVGKNVPKGKSPNGAGLTELTYMSRTANPGNGKNNYLQ